MNSVEEGYKTNFLLDISTAMKGNEKISTSVLITNKKWERRIWLRVIEEKCTRKTINKQGKIC